MFLLLKKGKSADFPFLGAVSEAGSDICGALQIIGRFGHCGILRDVNARGGFVRHINGQILLLKVRV